MIRVKLITGFREDQQYSIDAEEAHKAYFLFMNPEQRGVFSNGLALMGSDIRRIEPDWQGTMGWNPSHKLTGDDWAVINEKGMTGSMGDVMVRAKTVAALIEEQPNLIALPLSQVELPKQIFSDEIKKLAAGMKA